MPPSRPTWRAPADEVLAPLVEQLHGLLRQLGGIEQVQATRREEVRGVEYALEQNGHALRRARAAIAQGRGGGPAQQPWPRARSRCWRPTKWP